MNIVWDETPHLEGGLLLSQGHLQDYFALTRYPPLLDTIIAGYFKLFGASVFAGRLVSVTFSLLTLVVVFKLASKAYGRKIAFLSSLILATMPGFIWLSRVSLLEMALEFFFVTALLLFLYWLHSGKNTTILLSGIVLGCAFLTKYQGLVAGLVMVISVPFVLYHSQFKAKISRLFFLIIASGAIVVPVLISIYASGTLSQWISLIQQSDMQTNQYSVRFPMSIFYLLEMTVPLDFVHPINILVFILGLHGLALFIWRRKPEDKLFLIWFAVVYVFFTFIATKSWRYVMPIFPVIAISAASFISFLYDKLQKTWKAPQVDVDKKLITKILAGFLILFTTVALVYSTVDAYGWLQKDAVSIPLPDAVHYVANGFTTSNQSVMVIAPDNYINQDMTDFYLSGYEAKNNLAWQYPLVPVDAYTPDFNITQMISLCQQKDVKYLLLYENKNTPFFNSTITPTMVLENILQSGKFYDQSTFGTAPRRIFVLQVNETAM
jgi:MFS family permease